MRIKNIILDVGGILFDDIFTIPFDKNKKRCYYIVTLSNVP